MTFKHLKRLFCAAAISSCLALVFTSCELVTEDPAQPTLKPANHVVINEVFTLPESNQRAFSWIELYNPRPDTVNLLGWSLTFTAHQYRVAFLIDTTFTVPRGMPQLLGEKDSVFSLTFGLFGGFVPGGVPGFRLNGYDFITIASNEELLKSYTDFGPGNGPKVYASPLFAITGLPNRQPAASSFAGSVEQVVRVDDSTYAVVLGYCKFMFKQSDQIVLKNASGAVVDVVRYGNYTSVGTDPYPANRSIGIIPEFQSIARWNGAYSTGNTADDFYITGTQVPLTRPIPQWLSQAYHK